MHPIFPAPTTAIEIVVGLVVTIFLAGRFGGNVKGMLGVVQIAFMLITFFKNNPQARQKIGEIHQAIESLYYKHIEKTQEIAGNCLGAGEIPESHDVSIG